MQILLSIILFLFGTIGASFIGVLVARLYTGQSFVKGRSRCDACNAILPTFSLIPVISYLVMRGRAICCGACLSPRESVTEILLGVLFVLAYLRIGFTVALPFMLISLSLLLALVLYDLSHQILPQSLLIAFVVVSAATGFFLAQSPSAFFHSLVIASIIATSLALIHFLSGGRAMGFSDAPLALGLALLVGPVAFPGFIFSFWIGAVIGIIILLRRPSGSRMGVEVPFAPFLAAGFTLAYFTQWNILDFVAVLH